MTRIRRARAPPRLELASDRNRAGNRQAGQAAPAKEGVAVAGGSLSLTGAGT